MNKTAHETNARDYIHEEGEISSQFFGEYYFRGQHVPSWRQQPGNQQIEFWTQQPGGQQVEFWSQQPGRLTGDNSAFPSEA